MGIYFIYSGLHSFWVYSGVHIIYSGVQGFHENIHLFIYKIFISNDCVYIPRCPLAWIVVYILELKCTIFHYDVQET